MMSTQKQLYKFSPVKKILTIYYSCMPGNLFTIALTHKFKSKMKFLTPWWNPTELYCLDVLFLLFRCFVLVVIEHSVFVYDRINC